MKKQTVSAEQVRKIARLAKLRLGEEQCALYTRQINAILEHVKTLEQVDVSGVEPLSHVLELVNVSRQDRPTASLARETVLANAPQRATDGSQGQRTTDGEFFLVPAVLKTGR
ncbi:MAG: Asp-tRNA(Asn)/Glu-tRNA(Gln) amidotransferase subunit GatC [Candidatus Marinimicrobia bacterium]|nr:Asp-tRNA(Asn)/Glu-tRNA(Gln) amidotransferase subunit GatC [Candidatus Neomarinimicrobiota bacterium]